MKEIEKYIYLNDETRYDYGVEWLPGWYFADETEQLNGPFSTIEEARAAMKTYIETLL